MSQEKQKINLLTNTSPQAASTLPMGNPRGEAVALSFGRHRGFIPRVSEIKLNIPES